MGYETEHIMINGGDSNTIGVSTATASVGTRSGIEYYNLNYPYDPDNKLGNLAAYEFVTQTTHYYRCRVYKVDVSIQFTNASNIPATVGMFAIQAQGSVGNADGIMSFAQLTAQPGCKEVDLDPTAPGLQKKISKTFWMKNYMTWTTLNDACSIATAPLTGKTWLKPANLITLAVYTHTKYTSNSDNYVAAKIKMRYHMVLDARRQQALFPQGENEIGDVTHGILEEKDNYEADVDPLSPLEEAGEELMAAKTAAKALNTQPMESK